MSSGGVHEVAVVGAGLSGLTVAVGIHLQLDLQVSPASTGTAGGIGCGDGGPGSWVLLEAHATRVGGRMLNSDDGIDLGPAWVWPAHQPRIDALLTGLQIPSYQQPDEKHGSTHRVTGGANAIAAAQLARIPADNVRMGFAVVSCVSGTDPDGAEVVVLTSESGDVVKAHKVVFAVPPRMISTGVTFSPALSPARVLAMDRSRTWMACVTKVVVRYETPFWIELGLPSNTGVAGGPAFQVYDAGPSSGSPAALTFFALATGDGNGVDAVLAKRCIGQLARVWNRVWNRGQSTEATDAVDRLVGSMGEVTVQRWPLERFISDDATPRTIHPHPGPVKALAAPDWAGRLLFAGTEADLGSPGVMEGAIGAAHRVLDELGMPVR